MLLSWSITFLSVVLIFSTGVIIDEQRQVNPSRKNGHLKANRPESILDDTNKIISPLKNCDTDTNGASFTNIRKEAVEEPWNEAVWGKIRTRNDTKNKVKLKRVRRARGDGQAPPSRKPVALTNCRCPVCSTQTGAFQNGSFENVAFNKPAVSSSVWNRASHSAGACGAVNGNSNDVIAFIGDDFPNCYHSGHSDEYPWWTVDLEYVFTITTLKLVRQGAFYNRISDLLLSVDGLKCSSTDSEREAHKHRNQPSTYFFDCETVLTGRHVRIQKHIESGQSYYRISSFCEVQIWVCKPGTYGRYPDSCAPCPERCMYSCDNLYGCDVRVLHNVAVKKTVTMSSRQFGEGLYLTDAIIWYSNNERRCVYTTPSSRADQHWITVALGTTFTVFRVHIHSRADCCSPVELRYIRVMVTQTDGEKTTDLESAENTQEILEALTCGYVHDGVPTGVVKKVRCTAPLTGKYVHVVKRDTAALSMCELEVYGHHRYQLVPGAACSDYSKIAVCAEGSVCVSGICRININESCTSSDLCNEGLECYQGVCTVTLALNEACYRGVCLPGLTCDASSTTCRRVTGGPCSSDAECQTRAVCDSLSTCRLRLGQSCQEDSQCPTGAHCPQGSCVCNTEVSAQEGDLCTPLPSRVNSACDSDDDCVTGSCVSQVCVCGANQSLSTQFSCKVQAGSSCASDSSCNVGLKCEQGQCKIKPGQSCHKRPQYCSSGTTCEHDICKPTLEQSCVGLENLCFSELVCSGGRCIHLLGKSCATDSQCTPGVCSVADNSTCKLDAGQRCASSDTTQCRAGTSCHDGTVCKVDTGQECRETQDCRDDSNCSPRAGSASNVKKCRLPLGATDCRDDEDCVDSTVCDLQRICRLTKNSACQTGLGTCLTGAVCANDGTCQCNPDVTDATSARCHPKPGQAGGACDAGSSCTDSAALCADSTCQCDSTYAIDFDLSCRIKAGFPCPNASSCISNADCVDGICSLKVGALCHGDSRAYCQLDSICDVDDTCRLNIHQSCVNSTNGCRQGTACDSLKRCKRKPGSDCREDGDCMAGAHCSQENQCECTAGVTTHSADTCVPEDGIVGGRCQVGACRDSLASCNTKSGLCQCQKGYSGTPVSLACAKDLGQDCVKDSECASGLVCDPAVGECRIQLGQICDTGNERQCATGLVCDFDSVCKMSLNGNCSGDNEAYCKSGTFCDWLGTCKVGVGAACNVTEGEDPCPAGAICADSKCICDLEMASVYGIICKPLEGRYGGSCQVQCTVENSQCVDNICRCKANFVPGSSFNCLKDNNLNYTEGINKLLILAACSGVAFLILGIIFIALVLRRQKHKQDARTALTQQEAENMQDITRLKEAAEKLIQEEEIKNESGSSIVNKEASDSGSSGIDKDEAADISSPSVDNNEDSVTGASAQCQTLFVDEDSASSAVSSQSPPPDADMRDMGELAAQEKASQQTNL